MSSMVGAFAVLGRSGLALSCAVKHMQCHVIDVLSFGQERSKGEPVISRTPVSFSHFNLR